jgi:hypothetical protein
VGWLIDTSIWIAVERGTLGAADIHAITRREPELSPPISALPAQAYQPIGGNRLTALQSLSTLFNS